MDEALRRTYESLSLDELRSSYGSGVTGFGIGKRYVDGRPTDEDCIVIYVEEKLPSTDLEVSGVPMLPESIDGVPVDVEEGGKITAGLGGPRLSLTDDLQRLAEIGGLTLDVLSRIRRDDRPQLDLDDLLDLIDQLCPGDPEPPLTSQWRPIQPGVSGGHPNITAGTVGALVLYRDREAMLSNNHVFADQNRADLGDPIWQPGRADNGVPSDAVATLADYLEISFGSARPNEGHEDSAVAVLDDGIQFDPTYPRSGDLLTGVVPEADIAVTGEEFDRLKIGRTTGQTKGTLRTFPTTARVSYGGGRVAEFPWQVSYTDMSDPGDSGSAIRMLADGRMEALLYAGSDFVTLGHVAERVFDHYGLEVLS